ncbi:hypothetical protein C819_02975 [Lachnospiraceae bacterium 10-1]|nr:hypothetical protein C819_02975 [Lachnospiraceae bacterium 10-1]
MEQLEKLTAEQKKIYESLMVYDSVMTRWIDAEEENRVKFRNNPLKAFLCATGMGKEEFQAMMSPLGDGKALQTYMEDGNDFELEEAKTSYTNGWDVANQVALNMINLVLKKIVGDGFWESYTFTQDDKSSDIIFKAHIETMEVVEINDTEATMRMVMKECTASGKLERTDVDVTIGEIEVRFDVNLEEVSFETESGKTLDLYLDLKKKDAIQDPIVEVQIDSRFIKYALEGLLADGIGKIINSLPMEPYKICSVEMDEEKLQKADWIIPDYASFSGTKVTMEDAEDKKIMAVFLKTLDKEVSGLNLDILKEIVDYDAEGTVGIAERLTLGHIIPIILTQALDDDTVSMYYDEDKNYLSIDKTVSIKQSGADVKIKDLKVFSRENGYHLTFNIDGNWGAGMIDITGDGYCDIKLEFAKDEKGKAQLFASVSNPILNCSIDVPWWEYLLIFIAMLIPVIGQVIDVIICTILAVAMEVISSVFSDIQENGIDGLPVDVVLPIKWNDMKFVDIKSIHFSKGLKISYSMKVAEESEEQ